MLPYPSNFVSDEYCVAATGGEIPNLDSEGAAGIDHKHGRLTRIDDKFF